MERLSAAIRNAERKSQTERSERLDTEQAKLMETQKEEARLLEARRLAEELFREFRGYMDQLGVEPLKVVDAQGLVPKNYKAWPLKPIERRFLQDWDINLAIGIDDRLMSAHLANIKSRSVLTPRLGLVRDGDVHESYIDVDEEGLPQLNFDYETMDPETQITYWQTRPKVSIEALLGETIEYYKNQKGYPTTIGAVPLGSKEYTTVSIK